MNYSDNMDQVDIYKATSYGNIDLESLTANTHGWVVPVGNVTKFTTKSGKDGQSLIVLANGPGYNSMKHLLDDKTRKRGSNVNRVNLYIPSSKKGDNINTLYISMAVLGDYFKDCKSKQTNVDFKEECSMLVSNFLSSKLDILCKQELLGSDDFDINVYISDDDECKAFGFINFKKGVVTPWQIAISRICYLVTINNISLLKLINLDLKVILKLKLMIA